MQYQFLYYKQQQQRVESQSQPCILESNKQGNKHVRMEQDRTFHINLFSYYNIDSCKVFGKETAVTDLQKYKFYG